MKTLDEITAEIHETKERIFCQEAGNDMYYTSPLYHRHLAQLQDLEREQSILLGKSAPFYCDFLHGFTADYREGASENTARCSDNACERHKNHN